MKSFFLMVFCCLLFSCGVPKGTRPTKAPRILNLSLSSTPLFLFKQSIDCKTIDFMDSSEFYLHLFLSGTPTVISKNFEGLITKNLIRNLDNNVIFKSLYGDDIELVHKNGTFKFMTHTFPRDIDLCPDVVEYDKNTVEGAALNASYFINKAHKSYSRATGASIPPVILKISPKIWQTTLEEGKKRSLYLTDNAYYHPEEKSITFLPHSLEARLSGFTMSFWEIPMVSAHEYGHHIFNHLFEGTLPPRGAPIDLCFGNHLMEPFSSSRLGTRNIQISDVLHAYNEGFADLVAFYTLDMEERRLTSVKCMEASREVESETFFNGSPKVFSPTALKSFFANTRDGTRKTCQDVDYQDVHFIEAIFAHNADRFLSTLTDSNEQKLQLLHDWVKKLRTERSRLSSLAPQRSFEEIFQIFLRLSLKKFDKKFDRSRCDEVRRIYPDLAYQLTECS